MKYELIDENGRVVYTGLSLCGLHQLADMNGYMIIYADGNPASITVSGCCGPMYKAYTVVPVEEGAESAEESAEKCDNRYNLIDKDGNAVYAGISLSEIKDLAKRSGYRVCWAYGRPVSVEHADCRKGKVYDIVPVYVGTRVRTDSSSRFTAMCAELSDLYTRKNRDYGDSFHKTFEEYGVTMAAIRLEDKLNRFKRLVKNDAAVKDESITDTLKDLANYAIMTLMELKSDEIV